MIKEMFPARLKSMRKKTKLTQEEIAERFGVARSTYSGYETGNAEPDLITLNKIADYFQVSTDYLLGRTDDPRMYSKDYYEIRESFELTKDETLSKIKFTYNGIELTHPEKIEFLAIARGIFDARKSLRETT